MSESAPPKRRKISRPWKHLTAPGDLVNWRRAEGLSQVEAAHEFGIAPSKLNCFEKGRRRPCLDTAATMEVRTDGKVRAISWALMLTPETRRAANSNAA